MAEIRGSFRHFRLPMPQLDYAVAEVLTALLLANNLEEYAELQVPFACVRTCVAGRPGRRVAVCACAGPARRSQDACVCARVCMRMGTRRITVRRTAWNRTGLGPSLVVSACPHACMQARVPACTRSACLHMALCLCRRQEENGRERADEQKGKSDPSFHVGPNTSQAPQGGHLRSRASNHFAAIKPGAQ